ncbi:hypothetical protein N4G41_03860 [Kosakonia sacchari]|uniref:hypothetical protein n=1 Tax=Kosakonia sacchari TaxID=1158459 RepID=UPI002ACEE65A|nr:hypothetical protein [Kosakonia sacchari]MDZ7320765.1 hypothetical protein [Kosakonia sacchari]
MANKKLPGGRKSAGRISTSAEKLVMVKKGSAGVAISELPAADKITGAELFPVVQEKETRGATVGQIQDLIPAGETGASAYDIWVAAQPDDADTSESAYLAFMEGKPGKDGEDGKDGLSAYQVWVTAQPEGEDTSEAAYLESMKGRAGKDGADGLSAYQIWADAQEEGSDTSETAYIAFQAGKNGEDGHDGKSAYQIWLDADHDGTEEDFLNWLKTTASIDPLKTNILKNTAAGLYVNGAHPIIPKMASSTINSNLETFKNLPDGGQLYTITASLANPLGVASMGGVSVYTQVKIDPTYFFLGSKNELITTQYYVSDTSTTASVVKVTITVIMSATPAKAYGISDAELKGTAEDQTLTCPVSVKLLVGTTLSQNGMN